MGHFNVVLVILWAGYVFGQKVEVELSKAKAQVGDDVTFTCKVKDAPSLVMLGKMVNFFDADAKSPQQELERISTGVDIFPKYKDAERFRLSTIEHGDWIHFNLEISDVTREDSAYYVCKIHNTEVSGSKLLEVFTSPETVGFETAEKSSYEPGESLLTLENHETEVKCSVLGVVPLPVMRIKLDGKDLKISNPNVTVRKPDCYVNAYEGCLLHFSNDVTVTTNLKLDYKSDGKSLKCEAYQRELGSEPITTAVQEIEMHYAPKFKCNTEQQALLHQKNAEIRCIIQANPSLQTVMFEFLWNGEMDTLQPGSRTDDNEIHVTQTKLSETETEVKLILKEVYQRHYLDYKLKTSNQVGDTSKTISLVHNNGSGTYLASTNVTFICLMSIIVCYLKTL